MSQFIDFLYSSNRFFIVSMLSAILTFLFSKGLSNQIIGLLILIPIWVASNTAIFSGIGMVFISMCYIFALYYLLTPDIQQTSLIGLILFIVYIVPHFIYPLVTSLTPTSAGYIARDFIVPSMVISASAISVGYIVLYNK